MSATTVLKNLQDLIPFQNKNQIVEILVRGENGKIKAFQKAVIENISQNDVKEKVQEAINLLNKNNEIAENSIKLLNSVTKLGKLNLVLSGLNLCATCVGFAIMYDKLNKLSGKIDSIVNQMKTANSIQANFEFDKILSKYSNMLDCRRKQNYYSEDQLWKLVADEYDVLNMLIRSFSQSTVSGTEEIIFSILSLASMLSVSLKYFDETYYFNNKEKIQDGNSWHINHSNWVGVFDKLLSPDFIKAVQDHGFLELELNTVENDCYYLSFSEQIKKLKQDVEDNQILIMSTDDQELYNTIISELDQQIVEEIESELEKQGVDPENEEIKKVMQAVVA